MLTPKSATALPQASVIKLMQIGVMSMTLDRDLPLSGLTSLILVQSPSRGPALEAILSWTPWLQRFVCIGKSRDIGLFNRSGAKYSIGDTLNALITHVAQSLEFLALDYPLELSRRCGRTLTTIPNDCFHQELHDLRKLSGLRAACVPSALLYTWPFAFDMRDLTDVLPLSLKTLALHDVLSSVPKLKAIQGTYVRNFHCHFRTAFASWANRS